MTFTELCRALGLTDDVLARVRNPGAPDQWLEPVAVSVEDGEVVIDLRPIPGEGNQGENP